MQGTSVLGGRAVILQTLVEDPPLGKWHLSKDAGAARPAGHSNLHDPALCSATCAISVWCTHACFLRGVPFTISLDQKLAVGCVFTEVSISWCHIT